LNLRRRNSLGRGERKKEKGKRRKEKGKRKKEKGTKGISDKE
jgi:hypothetical protein